MKFRGFAAAAVGGAVALFLGPTANASSITFSFDAAYTGSSTGDNTSNLTDYSVGLVIGQIIHGSFSYDTSSAPISTSSLPGTFNQAIYSAVLSFSLPSLTFSSPTSITVTDGISHDDSYSIGAALPVASVPVNHTITADAFIDLDGPSTVFNSTALPTSFFNLSDFIFGATFSVSQIDSSPTPSDLFGFSGLDFDITNITQISETPLPAALPLFATGLGALGLLARRRKRAFRIERGVS